jgi:hypothetical protein
MTVCRLFVAPNAFALNSRMSVIPSLATRVAWIAQAALGESLLGCDAQHDLPAAMRSTAQHLVGSTGFFQREHSSDVRNQSAAVE